MKRIVLILANILLVIIINISFVWAIIDFILYLAKDKPFNWVSVLVFIASFVIIIIELVIAIYKKYKERF